MLQKLVQEAIDAQARGRPGEGRAGGRLLGGELVVDAVAGPAILVVAVLHLVDARR
jgi:hypothetical protein